MTDAVMHMADTLGCVEVPASLLAMCGPSTRQYKFEPSAVMRYMHTFAATSLDSTSIEELCNTGEELELAALEDESDEEEAGESISNIGGFHSKQDLFASDERHVIHRTRQALPPPSDCSCLVKLREAVSASVATVDPSPQNAAPEAALSP
jgi:hypothetical protein